MDADKIHDYNTRYVSSTSIRIHVDGARIDEKAQKVADCLCDVVVYCQFEMIPYGDCRYHNEQEVEICGKKIKPNILKEATDPQNALTKCPEYKWEHNNCTRNECDDNCNKSTTWLQWEGCYCKGINKRMRLKNDILMDEFTKSCPASEVFICTPSPDCSTVEEPFTTTSASNFNLVLAMTVLVVWLFS